MAVGRPAVFLDRDGTLNVEKNYLYRFEDWEWIPGAVEAIRRINSMGYLAIVVTNQAGIARGYYGEEDVQRLHFQVNGALADAGARIDAFYICPHHPEHGDVRDCSCRKPGIGMLTRAQCEFGIGLEASWLVGDKLSDIEAGKRAGVTPILVRTGYGAVESLNLKHGELCKADVLAAVQWIELKESERESRRCL